MNSKSAGYNSLTIAAGDSIEIPAHAEFLRCLEADGNFEFNIEDGGWQYMAAGIGYISDNPQGFQTFRLRNNSAADISLVIAFGWGELRDDRLSLVGDVLPIEFSAPQPVEQSGAWAVSATFPEAQAVLQGGNWTVQPITFEAPQFVKQSGNWTVQPITFAAPQSVKQSGNWTVQPITFAAPQSVKQDGVWRTSGPSLMISTGSVVIGAAASEEVFANRAGRTAAIIENLGTEPVWIRSNGAVHESGQVVYPGEKVTVRSENAFYVCNTGTVPVLISRQEEYWV